MQTTKNIEKVMAYIEDNSSTWVPLKLLPTFPTQELAAKDLVLREKKGEKYVTFPYYSKMEKEIARSVVQKIKPVDVDVNKIQAMIRRFEYEESERKGCPFAYVEEQKEGIITLLSNTLAILTGGPGTGKTSVLSGMVQVQKWLQPYSDIAFTAPTGKAAQRITESTGFEASTLQSTLGDTGVEGADLLPIYADILIIDEASFLDMETFYKTLLCLGPFTRCFLVGDVDQLPSVGVGAILRDLIDSGIIPCVQLQRAFRQDKESGLAGNIDIVKKGCHIPLQETADFERIHDSSAIQDTVIRKYMEEVSRIGIENVGLLTPYRKVGSLCSEVLNAKIQNLLNPAGKKPSIKAHIERDDREICITFREGDPVMQLENRREVVNGEIGTIERIEKEKLTVKYFNCRVCYYPSHYQELDLAYSLSINKSQGSEYESVIAVFAEEHQLLDRNTVYTAITRGKKKACVVGSDKVIQKACKIQSAWKRYTFLVEELLQLVMIEHIHTVITETQKIVETDSDS